MATTTFYRKKDFTVKEFFKRFGQFIPLYNVDFDAGRAQADTQAGGAIAIYFTNDEDVPDYLVGPKGRAEITRVLQVEETGWQQIDIENYGIEDGLALRKRACKLMIDKFGAIEYEGIVFPLEDEREDGVDWDNLPPEVLAFAPDNPFRAWLLYNSTPEEREEAMRTMEADERRRQEMAPFWAQLSQWQEELERRQ